MCFLQARTILKYNAFILEDDSSYRGSHNRTVCLFNLTNIKVVRSLSIKASEEHQNDGVGTF